MHAWARADVRNEAELERWRAVWARTGRIQMAGPADGFDRQALWGRFVRTTRSQPEADAPASIGAGLRPARLLPAIATTVVAVLGIGLSLHGLRHDGHLASSGREYATVARQRLSVTLVDGTRFTLAPASRLRVVSDRTVDLEGEALFTVMHDEARPFAVRAANAVVTDIGTEFNVRAYMGDNAVRVAVAAGQVCVGTRSGRCNQSLQVGDFAAVSDTGVVVTHGADIAAITAWTQGRLVFEDTPLPEVTRELARAFDLDVTVTDSVLAAHHVTASFGSESPDEILSLVARIVGADVRRSGRRVILVPRRDALDHRAPGDRVLTTATRGEPK